MKKCADRNSLRKLEKQFRPCCIGEKLPDSLQNDAYLNRRQFLKTAGLVAASAGTLSVLTGCAKVGQILTPTGRNRPNIIVIISDDLGYADIGCYGCKDIDTPNIDSIAKNGILFTNGYVSCPVCSPTRAGLMTGRYQQRFGHELNPGGDPANGLPVTEITIADVLKSAGYITGAVGKWHLGMSPQFHPLKRGFDEFFGFLGGGHSYIDPGLDSTNPIIRDNQVVDEKEYLTDAFSREAVAFIQRHRDKPFFLYLAYNAVHTPMQAPERYRDGFKHITDSTRRVYAGMLAAMDEGIGRVLDKLRELDLEKDTLLFFVSDNGGSAKNGSHNAPLRAHKGTIYEGGIRVPFLAQWPGRLKAGQVYDHPVITLDVLPTAAAAAGAELPRDRVIDGVNLLPYLIGERKGSPHKALFWRYGQNYAVRRGNWKLVKVGKKQAELFNLALDVSESQDLSEQRIDIVKDLQDYFIQWNSQMIPPLWKGRKRLKKRPKRKKNI